MLTRSQTRHLRTLITQVCNTYASWSYLDDQGTLQQAADALEQWERAEKRLQAQLKKLTEPKETDSPKEPK